MLKVINNKEWLSLHQCIDENCQVHHNIGTYHVTSKSGSQNQNFNNKPINQTDFDEKKNVKDVDDNDTVDVIHKTGGFTMIARCYEDIDTTNFSAEKIKSRVHELDTKEHVSFDNNGNCLEKASEGFKPRFMCTWLDRHTDINKYPFYKFAVQLGNEKRVREDAAVYSKLVTNHIWASHKYIGEEDNNVEGESYLLSVRDLCSKASRSHENLSVSVDTVLKDIAEVDISDLKLKYGFLFDPKYINVSRSNGKGHRVAQHNHQGLQNDFHCIDYSNGMANIKSNYGRDYLNKHTFTEAKYYYHGELNNSFYRRKDNLQSGQVCSYNTNELNCVSYNDQSLYDENKFIHPASDIEGVTYVNSPTAAKGGTSIDYNKTPDQHGVQTIQTGWSSDLHPSTDLQNSAYMYSERHCRPVPGNINCDTTRPCLTNPYSSNDFKVGNIDFQAHVINSPCKPCISEIPYHNLSPLVSSQSCSFFYSPYGYQNSPFTRGHCGQYFTRRAKDPRIQPDTKRSIHDHHKGEGRNGEIVKSFDFYQFPDSPEQSKHRECSKTSQYQYDVYGEKSRALQSHALSQQHHRQYPIQTCDEDPFNDPLVHFNSVKEYNSDSYADSPSSEIFYGVMNDVNQHEDDVMDLFYGENNDFIRKTPIICESPSDLRHCQLSVTTIENHKMKSSSQRYRKSSRESSMSRELRSRFRRSKSSSAEADDNRHYFSKHSRHSKFTDIKRRSKEQHERNAYSSLERDKSKDHEYKRSGSSKRPFDRDRSRISRFAVRKYEPDTTKKWEFSSKRRRGSSKSIPRKTTRFRSDYASYRYTAELETTRDFISRATKHSRR